MSRKPYIYIAAAVLAAGVVACAKAPQEQIDSAQSALEQARNAQAETYAPEQLRAAQDALTSAMAEVKAQDGKFSLFRSYKKAGELLTEAERVATDADAAAKKGKEEARASAETAIKDAEAAVSEARAALDSAPAGKGTHPEIMAMKAELDTLSHQLETARTAFGAEKYMEAKTTAETVKGQAAQIAADVEQARAKKRST